MQVKEVMSTDVEFVKPDNTIEEVAKKMRDNNSGAILVGEKDKMVGMITDHDIVTKVIADDRDPDDVKAEEVMNSPVLYCYEDQEVEDVAENMAEQHVLRMLVVNRDKRACGVISHSDLADAVVKNNAYDEPLAQKVTQLASKVAA